MQERQPIWHFFTQTFTIFSVHFLDNNSPDLSCNTEEETVKLPTKPSIQWTTLALPTNVKRPQRENEHSHPTYPWGTLYFVLLYFTFPLFRRNHMPSAVRFSNSALTYLLTYLLHAAKYFLRSEPSLQVDKKLPAFYGTRKFITVFTSARHLSLS